MATKGTLKYRKVTRTPQSGPNKNKQMYYATAVTDREMNFEEFVTHISEHNSPYSRGTVHGVLMDTLDCLQELILDGKSVRLSDLGLFSIGMTSRAEDTKDKDERPSENTTSESEVDKDTSFYFTQPKNETI